MHQKIIITIAGLLFSLLSFGQTSQSYAELVNEAWQLYEKKAYQQSGEKYAEAFALYGSKSASGDRYNAACSWALANQKDAAFVQLFQVAEKGDFLNYQHITTDTDLAVLYPDKRWAEVTELIRQKKEKAEANLDKSLVALLDTIFQEDQVPRHQIPAIQEQQGADSEAINAHWKLIEEKDSLNLIKVQKILDERGWLGADIIGKQGNQTLFLVIQHADLKVQEKYLPMMQEAVKNGNASASSLALLEDRIALRQGKKQIYGSQIGKDQETGLYYVLPLEDPDQVNERRASVGLGKLDEYVSKWSITWDVEIYKKQLPEWEKRLVKQP